MSADQLIADYLRELKVSAWIRNLPKDRTADLERETTAAIEAGLAAAGRRDEATVYGVLDRLGSPGDIVERQSTAPQTGLRAALRAHGWGLAEIAALALLIVGPFFLWWLGPIFGIIVVRMAGSRWSHRATHRATVLIVGLFCAQVAISVSVLGLALSGQLGSSELMRILSGVGPFGYAGAGGFPTATPASVDTPLTPLEVLALLPAPAAGLLSGLFLALSPRRRRRLAANPR